MRAPLAVCIGLCLAFSLIACDSTTEEEQGAPLVPLAVGNGWMYVASLAPPYPPSPDTFSVEIVGQRTIIADGNEREAFEQIVRNDEGSLAPYRWLYGNEQGGHYLYGGVTDTSVFVSRSRVARYPARRGDREAFERIAFGFQRGFYVLDKPTRTVTHTDTTIVVAGRPLRCYGYEFRYATGDDTPDEFVRDFYAPGVGHVLQQIADLDGQVRSQVKLLSYEIR